MKIGYVATKERDTKYSELNQSLFPLELTEIALQRHDKNVCRHDPIMHVAVPHRCLHMNRVFDAAATMSFYKNCAINNIKTFCVTFYFHNYP